MGAARDQNTRQNARPKPRTPVCESLDMLRFDGLHFFGSRSICRLLVVEPSADQPRVVIAVHLEDSPGMSIWNDFESLAASVLSTFGEQPTRWLLHGPKTLDASNPDDDGTWTQASPGPESPEWRDISRSEAEEIAGRDLSDFDTEPASVIELAGEHDLLRSLSNVPEPERLPGDYLRAVPVAALPFAHGPFRCAHMQRFKDIGRLYEGLDHTVVGAHWYLTLTPDDFAACPFHQGDWRRVADASIAVLDSLAPGC